MTWPKNDDKHKDIKSTPSKTFEAFDQRIEETWPDQNIEQELRMPSSVTINCQVTKIVMNPGSQLSKKQNKIEEEKLKKIRKKLKKKTGVGMFYVAYEIICDIWDTDYNTDNWEPGFMTIFVTWQLFVSCDTG